MFPRPPFVPGWIPTELLVGSTVVIALALLGAIWWQFVRPAQRRRRAETAFWSPIVVGLVTAVPIAEGRVGWSSRETREVVAHVGSGGPVQEICTDFSWTPGLVTGSPRARVILVKLQGCNCIRWSMTLCGVPRRRLASLPEERVEIDLLGNRRLVTNELLDELWAFHDAPDTPETARAIWKTIRESSLAREYPELAKTLDYYVPR